MNLDKKKRADMITLFADAELMVAACLSPGMDKDRCVREVQALGFDAPEDCFAGILVLAVCLNNMSYNFHSTLAWLEAEKGIGPLEVGRAVGKYRGVE